MRVRAQNFISVIKNLYIVCVFNFLYLLIFSNPVLNQKPSQVILYFYLAISSVNYKYIHSAEILYSFLSANNNKKNSVNYCDTKEVHFLRSVKEGRGRNFPVLQTSSIFKHNERFKFSAAVANTICYSLCFIRFSEITNL